MTRIVIIEDHVLFREGLKCLIAEDQTLSVVGEAGDGRHGIDLVEKLKPAVVLLDLVLTAGPPGFEVLRHLRSSTKLLALSVRADDAFVVEAFLNGADGYVVKMDSYSDLRAAIDTVVDGGRFISPRLDRRRIGRMLERNGYEGPTARKRLTTREHEVLHLAAEGLTSAETAHRLFISPRTVEMHRANLMRKLGLRGTADLVRFAIRNRVIPA